MNLTVMKLTGLLFIEFYGWFLNTVALNDIYLNDCTVYNSDQPIIHCSTVHVIQNPEVLPHAHFFGCYVSSAGSRDCLIIWVDDMS